MLENTVKQHGGNTALVLGDRRISYNELEESSNKIANALIKMGVRKGDRVAMSLPNIPEFAIIYFGIVKTGGIAVPLDNRYKVAEFASVFDNSKPKVLITQSPLLESLAPDLSRFASIEHVIDAGSRHEDQFISYRQIMATSPAQRVKVELAPGDSATISYSGGPASHPHGAIFSHHNLCSEAIESGDGFKQTDKDVVMLFALPMYHNFGLISVLLTSVNKGSTIIIVPGTGISIGSLMEATEQEKGTMLPGVPYIFALAVKMAKREGVKNDLSSLRLCISGGAPLPIGTIRQFKKYYGLTIADIWGLTEAVSQVTCQPIDGTGRLGSSGKPLPIWEIKIVDNNDRELSPDQPGEIIVRGPIMKGYYNNPQTTAETIRNGWLYTGDIGKVDEDGYLFITGRKKRMIILKGQNVYPDEIEEVLHTHPKIAKARVNGIPDKLRGETVKAIIVLKKGETATKQEIRHFCQKQMADYKTPREIIFTDALPENTATETSKKNFRKYLADLSAMPPSIIEEKHNYMR